MSRELVKRLRRGVACERFGDMEPDIYSAECDMREAADLVERQDILIKEMAATLQNMALSLSNKDTEE